MSAINLPGTAALPIISGMLIGNYATIAILTVLPFNLAQMTLISVFSLIAHNLVVEGLIQHQSGINMAKITLIRIAVAILTVLVISQFFTATIQAVAVPPDFTVSVPFSQVLKAWAMATGWLLLKILGIITGVMVMLEVMKVFGWIEHLVRFLRPVMRFLGLSDRTSGLWVAAVVFGLMFGGAVVIEEAKNKALSKEELERLHISIGINHSMVEDPILFLALGINGFWLWVPKLLAGIAAVQVYRVTRYLKRRLVTSARRGEPEL